MLQVSPSKKKKSGWEKVEFQVFCFSSCNLLLSYHHNKVDEEESDKPEDSVQEEAALALQTEDLNTEKMFPNEEQEEQMTETEHEIQNSSPSLHQNQEKVAGDLLKSLFVLSVMLTVFPLTLLIFNTLIRKTRPEAAV